MANIQNTRAKLYGAKPYISDEPTEHVESEGDRLIKEMVQKQLYTTLSLEEELNRKKNFTTVREFVPLTEYTCGESSLKEFKESARKVAFIEELKTLGLSADEMKIVLDSKTENFLEKYRKAEKTIISNRLVEVLKKIEQAKKEAEGWQQKSYPSIGGRHERELALCVKPESERTKLVNFALSCQKPQEDPRPHDHPINHLKSIEEDLFGHLNKKRKSPSHSLHKAIKRSLVAKPKDTCFTDFTYEKGSSLWDVKTSKEDKMLSKAKLVNKEHIYTCKPQSEYLYTIKDNKIVPVSVVKNTNNEEKDDTNIKSGEAFVVPDFDSSNISLVSLDDISKSRLSVDEIRLLERFQNYKEGLPSQVLYIKNLAGSVTKEDLVSLFGHFEAKNNTRILYRLMTGKMKGQAFVTFSGNECARAALECVNGYILKGKPIIIQYGKGSVNGVANT